VASKRLVILAVKCPSCGEVVHRNVGLCFRWFGVEYWRCNYCGRRFMRDG
jgi:predicted RNA-binding Zn-ribbon protein involved in translation (DUF1610 family)